MTNKNKKILLIYPPSPVMNREDRCQQPTKELIVIPPLPPTDLMYLAAIAESVDFKAKIKDYSLLGDNQNSEIEEYKQDLINFQPDYVLVNVAMPTLENDLKSLEIAKAINPNIITIAKGATFLTLANEILKTHKHLDLIIKGEAEYTLKEILENKNYSDIKGLCYKKHNSNVIDIIENESRPFIENLDELPFPARHLVDNSIYKRPDNNKIQATIKVSRGCPFHCFFCLATPVAGSKVRRRSPENIIDEIKECISKYNIKNFLFWADIFDFDREWTINLCKKIIESGLKITWSANTRADTADFEMAQYMYKAGCRLVSIGVESGSQYMLDKMGKKTTLDDVRKTVSLFKKAKIRIYNYFVIGLPWETEETIEDTIKFAIELDSDFISFYTATPLPGSKFYEYAKENNLFNNETSFENAYFYPAVNTHSLSKDRVFELHKTAIKRFYLRPKYILRMLTRIKSFAEFKNYFVAGINVLFRK